MLVLLGIADIGTKCMSISMVNEINSYQLISLSSVVKAENAKICSE
jgi:hypothetical protein